MRYLHTMLRVRNLDAALEFFCAKLGLVELRRYDDQKGRYTNVFLAAPQDRAAADGKAIGRGAPLVELTYNWDSEDYGEARYFGHLAYEVDDIYALCERLMQAGVTINRPPRDGVMAFIRSPDRHSIELLQKGGALPPQEPWKSMPNTGRWWARRGQHLVRDEVLPVPASCGSVGPENRASRHAYPPRLPVLANASICQRALKQPLFRALRLAV